MIRVILAVAHTLHLLNIANTDSLICCTQKTRRAVMSTRFCSSMRHALSFSPDEYTLYHIVITMCNRRADHLGPGKFMITVVAPKAPFRNA
jgi:hypothetical protein